MSGKAISVSLTYTKNLGNYESVKISAGLDVPVDTTSTPIEAIYKSAYSLIEKIIIEESLNVGNRLRGQ